MPPPRGSDGGLSEASRLLQEGLQLLDERTREVDAIVEQAARRAQEMTADAERRAQELTAEAERRRLELEDQISSLRAEIDAAREELTRLRGRGRGRGAPAAPVPVPVPSEPAVSTSSPPPETNSEPVVPGSSAPEEAPPGAEDAAGTPRWGRPSTLSSAQQAIRSRSSRPRWLPRWLPFLLLLLIAGAALANGSLAGQTEVRAPSVAQPPDAATIAPTNAPLIPTVTPPPATSAPTATVLAVTQAFAATATDAPTVAPTATIAPTATRVPLTVPQPRAPQIAPAGPPPGDVSPDGPVVAAYTTYAQYSVRPGDTLNRLATQFGVSGESIMRSSGISDPNLLQVGQVLTIPRESGWLYRVQPNESLDQIAARFGTSVDDLQASSMLPTTSVQPGELLFIPDRLVPAPKEQR